MSDYTLFIDESGRFNPSDLKSDSQLAFLLIPGVFMTRDGLPRALTDLFPLNASSHSTEMSPKERDRLLASVLNTCDGNGWRLGRIRHNFALSDLEDTSLIYTRLLARMVIELYQTMCDEDDEPVFHIVYASVKIGKRLNGSSYYYPNVSDYQERHGEPILINAQEYERALHQSIDTELEIGQGLKKTTAERVLGALKQESGREHPALRLVDVVSNCSYRNARNVLSRSLKNALLKTLEPRDYELYPFKPQQQAEQLARNGALAQAITLTLQHLAEDLKQEFNERLQKLLRDLVEDLAEAHSHQRANALRELIYDLEDLVQRRRDHPEAERLFADLTREVLDPLEEQLGAQGSDVAWARHRLLCLALANANHSGELALAQARHEELVALQPRVQGRWEELPALMSAQLHWAVSCVDRLELDEAARLARRVEGFYKGMSALLREVEGGELVSQSPRANLRGQALGLLLWVRRHRCAEALARGEDPAAHLEEGRALGAEALALFEAPEDLARVDQQLAHLEGLAGRFDEAWELLARRSRDPNDDDPCPPRDEVAYGLARLSADALPFPLSHALRLRAMERLAAPSSCVASAPLDDFLGTATLPLLRGEQESYPAHSSLRALAQLAALAGDPLRALSALRALHALLTRGGGGDALKLLYLCACAEAVAALTLRGGEREALAQARALLKQELRLLPPALAPLPALSAYLGELLGAAHALERAAATREDPAAAARALLLTAARYAL